MITAMMLLSFMPAQAKRAVETKAVSAVAAKTNEAIDATQTARLEEIKAMDLSTLTRSEKKELRNEVKAIKVDQDERRGHDQYDGRHRHGVVFVTGGSLLLIIILIIVLV